MVTLYTLFGGAVLNNMLNAIAAFFSSNSWNIPLKIVLMASISAYAVNYIIHRDPLKFLKWVFVYTVVIGVLIVPKKNIQIVDLSDPTISYKVDNVPLGLAVYFSLVTHIGYGIGQAYDTFFSLPDAVSYSKTGLLFGATLAKNSLSVTTGDPLLNENFNGYIANCVIGDIMLNHKYSMADLMNSTDILGLITSRPSQLRRMIYINNTTLGVEKNNISCQEAAKKLTTDITQKFNHSGEYLGKIAKFFYTMSGNRVDKENLVKNLLQDSYGFFYGSSQTATDALKQNVAMAAVRNGLQNYASKNSDIGSLITTSTESSQMKSRLNWGISAKIGTTYLPLLHTLMILFMVALLPMIILVTVTDVAGLVPLKFYALSLVYFMSWTPLFTVLNYVMNFYAKGQTLGMIPRLSNVNELQLHYSDLSMIAGYLSLSIPFLALGITRGFASAMTHASGFITSTVTSAAGQVANSAADGNWTVGSVSTENVQGFKWDTNYNEASGKMTTQLDNASTMSISQTGTPIYNTQSAQSFLGTSGDFSSIVQSQYSNSIRSAQDQAIDTSKSVQEASRQVSSNLIQLSTALNKTESQSTVYHSDAYTSLKQAVQDANNAVDTFAQDHNISRDQAISLLNNKSSSGSFNAGVDAKVSGGIGKEGKMSLTVGASTALGTNFTTSSSDDIRDNAKEGYSSDHKDSAELSRQYQFAMDKISSFKFSETGGESNSAVNNLVENTSEAYEKSLSLTQSFNEKQGMVEALTNDASYVQNHSSAIKSNLDSEFVSYVHQTNPEQAKAILSDTSNPALTQQREQLYSDFASERVRNRINGILQENYDKIHTEYQNKADKMHRQANAYDAQSFAHKQQKTNLSLSADNLGITSAVDIATRKSTITEDYQRENTLTSDLINNRRNELQQDQANHKKIHQNETSTTRVVNQNVIDDQAFQDENPVRTQTEKDREDNKWK